MSEMCDHCQEDVRPHVSGYWVGTDGTSDCLTSAGGHEVDGAYADGE